MHYAEFRLFLLCVAPVFLGLRALHRVISPIIGVRDVLEVLDTACIVEFLLVISPLPHYLSLIFKHSDTSYPDLEKS